eukprot:5955031-Prymnesium_polylepis.1
MAPPENQAFIEKIIATNSARENYSPKVNDREFDLICNCPELLGEAFEYAASKVLGEGHGITLTLYHGGAERGVHGFP